MDKQYYKDYYHLERNHWWFRARMQLLETLLIKHINSSGTKNLKILNVGVATGATSIMLEKHGNVTSLEYDSACCDFLRETVGIHAVNASLTELPFENDSYDVICGFDVIEHIENDNLAVSEIYRVLKKGGFVYLTVPAFQSLWSSHDVVNHHFRRYRMNDFCQLIKNQNFVIVRRTYFNFILFPPVYLFRVFSKLIKKEKDRETAGSDFDHFKGKNILNSVFYRIFNMEKVLLKNQINFPFGISALLIAKK